MEWYYDNAPVSDLIPGKRWIGYVYAAINYRTEKVYVGCGYFRNIDGTLRDWQNSWTEDTAVLSDVQNNPGDYSLDILYLAENEMDMFNCLVELYEATGEKPPRKK